MKKTTFILIIMVAVLAVPFVITPVVHAQDDYGLEAAATEAGVPQNTNFPQTVGTLLFMAISLVGALFLILVVYGGFLWMTAGGNAEKTKKAGAIMRNGAIGVIIILSAYAITRFVIIEILVNSNGASGGGSSSLPSEMYDNGLAANLILDNLSNKIL